MYKDFLGVKDIENCIEEYFERQDRLERPYTVQGLALALDINIENLYKWSNENYGLKSLSDKENKELRKAIKKAKLKVEEYNSERLITNKQVTGIIFNLKNNFGWKDTQEITTNNTSNTNITGLSKEELKELLYAEQEQS